MVRKGLKDHMTGLNPDFRYRGIEQSRIETFSDAVFALAITLMVISTETPSSVSELKRFVFDLIPFGLCMGFMLYIWWEHFVFFIRYGLKNSRIVMMNGILLFLVLFYVYPLKFLAKFLVILYTVMISNVLGFETSLRNELATMISYNDMPVLMIIYGLGAGAIFTTSAWLYKYALKKKSELDLNEIEVFDTRTSIYVQLIMASVPLFSALFSIIFFKFSWVGIISGFLYMAYPLLFWFFARSRNKKRQIKFNPISEAE